MELEYERLIDISFLIGCLSLKLIAVSIPRFPSALKSIFESLNLKCFACVFLQSYRDLFSSTVCYCIKPSFKTLRGLFK